MSCFCQFLMSGVSEGDKWKVVRDLLGDNVVGVAGLSGVSDDMVDESG